MRIAMLGPLEVQDDDGHRVEIGGARLRALLSVLALSPRRVVSPEQLVDALWYYALPGGPANALQSLVTRLRAVIGRDRIGSHPGGYRLEVEREDVDVYEFEDRVAWGRRCLAAGDPGRAATVLRGALGLWRGRALTDVAELPFAEGPRTRLESLRQAALEERITADLAVGRYGEVIPELRALAADPLRERPRVQLMRALYGSGRHAEALKVYAETKKALVDELGADPAPELEEIYLAVLRHDPELTSHGAPRPRTNLRPRLTSFVGRDEQVAEVVGLLDAARLVTVTGAPGAGKTRLAVETAARLAERMPGGAWLVELAPLTGPAELSQAVLSALGVHAAGALPGVGGTPPHGGEPVDRLVAELRGRPLLLVLDNCEHLIDPVVRLADRLMGECPDLRVLATSREPLGISGERVWPVPPLSTPEGDPSADQALEYPAIRLFAERGAAIRSGFRVDAANVAAALRVCRALDGNPLAIELAAARLSVLSPQQIAARLDERFGLLTVGSRTAAPRHRTLGAVIDWSWDLLDDAERALLLRLSVFVGGATLEAIQRVCAGSQPSGPGVEATVDVLGRLVNKSLLVTVEAAEDRRYRLLETIRVYAAERLAERAGADASTAGLGEEEQIRRAYADYFLDFVETAEPQLRGRHQMVWLGRLVAEYDNVRAAVRWTIDGGDAEMAVRFAAALGWYWWLRGHWTEAAVTLAEVLELPGPPTVRPQRALAAAFFALGTLGREQDQARARERFSTARGLCDALRPDGAPPLARMMGLLLRIFDAGDGPPPAAEIEGLFDDPDRWLQGVARLLHGYVLLNSGKAQDAEHDLVVALTRFRALGERWGTSLALNALAHMGAMRGEHRRAVTLAEEAKDIYIELGADSDVLFIEGLLGSELWRLGERARGRALLEAALERAEQRDDQDDLVVALYNLGQVARHEGDLPSARRLFERAEAHCLAGAAVFPPHFHAMIVSALGSVAAAEGEPRITRERHKEALELAVAEHDNLVTAQILVAFADLAVRRGGAERAAVLLGAADGMRGMPDATLVEVPSIDAAARRALGDGPFTLAYRRGHGMSHREALDYADGG